MVFDIGDIVKVGTRDGTMLSGEYRVMSDMMGNRMYKLRKQPNGPNLHIPEDLIHEFSAGGKRRSNKKRKSTKRHNSKRKKSNRRKSTRRKSARKRSNR